MKRPGQYLLVFMSIFMLASFKTPQQGQVDGWVYERDKKGIKIVIKGVWKVVLIVGFFSGYLAIYFMGFYITHLCVN